MDKHRVFIAINLPENVKKKLSSYEDKWPDLPARWTKKDNIHLTLEFLGNISDEDVLDVHNIVRDVVSKYSEFSITLNKITYGPAGKIPPRMIWAMGEASGVLTELKEELDKELGILEGKGFKVHITLARIKKWDWSKIEPEERPEVDEDILIDFQVSSIEIMESTLKKGGPEYAVLESIQLKP